MTPPTTPSPSGSALQIPDHQLVRPIGRGAYGEVWLARNLLGQGRAVKIIRNGGAEGARAYERELDGIQQYEPISRSHEGQVHVLHVGRLEDGFYYVMELADDSATGSTNSGDLDSYTPKTIRSEINRRGRIPVEECIGIALRLAAALAYLHERRLVHRDIKPSNIIFVGGVPKLADIGLVAPSDATVSFVGTEGFLPPEGPGRPQGDLYSLGKVLYEMCTGRDRTCFPELPTLLKDDPDREALLEFNEVILRACEPEPKRRYQNAGEMSADLDLLHRGKSLKQQRTRERLLARIWRIGGSLTIGTAIAVATFVATREKARTSTLVPRPVRGLEQAIFWRNSFLPRQFDVSADGARIVFASEQGVSLWERETALLRPVALRGLDGWMLPRHLPAPRWAPNGEHFIISLMRKAAGSEADAVYAWALFLVQASTGEARAVGPEVPAQIRDICWLPNGSGVTYLHFGGIDMAVPRLYTQLLQGERVLWPDVLAKSGRWLLGGYSPDGQWLLLDGLQEIEFAASNIDEERDVWLIRHLGERLTPLVHRPGHDAYPAWAQDGKRVYFSSGGRPFVDTWGLWMVPVIDGSAAGQPKEFFAKLGQRIYHPKILTAGTQLVYAVVEPETRVWVAEGSRSGSPVKIARGSAPKLAPDGTTVFFLGETPEQQGIFAVGTKPGSVPHQVSNLIPLGLPRFSLSPDGTMLALLARDGRKSGIFVVPASGGKPLLIEELRELTMPVWSPDSQSLAYTKGQTLLRAGRDGTKREQLAVLGGWEYWSLRWSPKGSHIASFGYARPEDWAGTNAIYVVSLNDKAVLRLTPESESNEKEGLEWHPDGQRLTYQYYASRRTSQIRMAFLNGRPTELVFAQPQHWDYKGVWSPNGEEFHFVSTACQGSGKTIHVYHARSGQFTHALRGGQLPVWDAAGTVSAWAEGEPHRSLETLDLSKVLGP